MATRIQLRRGTTAEWAAANPVLAAGEAGVDLTTGETRVGDGVRTWSALPSERAAAAVKAYHYGVRAGTGTAQNAALAAAFQAAKSTTGGGTVELPPGVITISGTFPLAGYSAGLRGAGGSNTPAGVRVGTVLRCINQTGPVLDFTGFEWPAAMTGVVVFERFTVEGDNLPDPTKTHRGIYIPPGETAASFVYRDITIDKCGGAGIEMSDAYFGLLQSVTLCNPIGATANDVPYLKATRCNGTVFLNVGLRSLVFTEAHTHTGDAGVSGAFILDGGSDLGHLYTRGSVLSCWAENLHVPSGGAIVVSATSCVSHHDWAFFDCYKVNGGTNTAYVSLPAVAPSSGGLARAGGNTITGVIEGQTAYHSDPVWIDYGVHDSQGGNAITGAKGWGGNNVLLDAGVGNTTVQLLGGERLDSSPGWVDNSGTVTNTLIDAPLGVWKFGRGPSGKYPIDVPGIPAWRTYIPGRYYGPYPIQNNAGALGAGICTVVPFWVSGTLTFAKISCIVTTAIAASSVRLGLYASTANDSPGALLLDAGVVDSSTTGVKEITVTRTLQAGLYWLAALPFGGAVGLQGVGAFSLAPVATQDLSAPTVNCYYTTGLTTGVLPTPWTSQSCNSGGYRLMVKAQ